MMKSEKSRLQFLPRPPTPEQRTRRLILGGEHESDIKSSTLLGRPHDFVCGKALDPDHLLRPRNISRIGPADFVGGGPGGESPRSRTPRFKNRSAMSTHHT